MTIKSGAFRLTVSDRHPTERFKLGEGSGRARSTTGHSAFVEVVSVAGDRFLSMAARLGRQIATKKGANEKRAIYLRLLSEFPAIRTYLNDIRLKAEFVAIR